jgi:anti-sigma factor RsiW
MKKNRNQLTDRQLDRFIADLRELPAEAVGEHLTDDEFIGYVSEELSTEEVPRLDKHLASCAACAGEVERLFEVSQAWQSAQGAARLTALRWRIRSQQALNRLADALSRKQPDFAFQAAHAATAQAWRGETEGGLLHWFIEEDPDSSDLIIRLDSVELALEGAKLRLTAGEWRSDVVLSRVASDQVGAEALLPSAECINLPPGTLLLVEVVREEPGRTWDS